MSQYDRNYPHYRHHPAPSTCYGENGPYGYPQTSQPSYPQSVYVDSQNYPYYRTPQSTNHHQFPYHGVVSSCPPPPQHPPPPYLGNAPHSQYPSQWHDTDFSAPPSHGVSQYLEQGWSPYGGDRVQGVTSYGRATSTRDTMVQHPSTVDWEPDAMQESQWDETTFNTLTATKLSQQIPTGTSTATLPLQTTPQSESSVPKSSTTGYQGEGWKLSDIKSIATLAAVAGGALATAYTGKRVLDAAIDTSIFGLPILPVKLGVKGLTTAARLASSAAYHGTSFAASVGFTGAKWGVKGGYMGLKGAKSAVDAISRWRAGTSGPGG